MTAGQEKSASLGGKALDKVQRKIPNHTASSRAGIDERERARAALQFIPPDLPREQWVQIGMAAHAAELDFDTFNDWSAGAGNYDAKDARTAWKSFKPGKGIGAGTLFKIAAEHGWQPPKGHNGHSVLPTIKSKSSHIQPGKKAPPLKKSVRELWEAFEPATDNHPYVFAKNGRADGLRLVPAADTLKVAGQSVAGWLVVPALSLEGELRTLQFISPQGKKLNLPGHSFADGMFVVGEVAESDRFFLVEGIGQAWACWRATGCASIVCFGAGRMAAVAAILRAAYPDRRLILVPDKGKEGQAAEVAHAVSGEWVELPQDKPANFDANDYALEHGADELDLLLDKTHRPPEPARLWPPPIDLAALAKREPQPPRFIVPDYLPCGYATLFAGHGGVGKSGIALFLAVCIALGIPFFGIPVQVRRVLYLACEDRENLLHWRLHRICKHLGIDLAALHGHLDILDLVGHPSVLWQMNREGASLTPPYMALDEMIKGRESQIVFVDGISDTYGGNENARSEVKAFINSLLGLIPEDGAVLLVGHIAKPAATFSQTSEGYSGSTGWHNSVRARWYLRPEELQSEDGVTEKTGDLILDLQKSNLGPTDRSMRFRWDSDSHLFVGQEVIGATTFDKKFRDREEQEGIMAALRNCPDSVPAASNGTRTSFHVLSACPEFPSTLKSGNAGRRRFSRHIQALRQIGCITESSIRRANRHYTAVLVASDKARADAPNAEN